MGKISKDEIWKEILETMFPEFCDFFLPELNKLIDYSKPVDFLEQELNKIFFESESKKRRTDKLVKVYLKDGSEKLVLVHIEIQGYKDDNFQERMFSYFYRIYDRYKTDIKDIVAIVLFTEDIPDYKPSRFELNSFGTKLIYEYNTYKILEQDEKKLLENKNIFSYVILAAYYLLQSKNNEKKKYNFKLKLAQLLIKNDYQETDIEKVLKFIDILLYQTDKNLERLFLQEVKNMAISEKRPRILSGIEEIMLEDAMKKVMPIAIEKAMPIAEKRAEKKVKKEAKIEGKIEQQKLIATNLKKEGLEIDLIVKVTGLTKKEVEKL